MLKQWFLRPVGALALKHHSQKAINNIASSMRWPRVEILMNYAGAGALTVGALLVQLASQQGAALRCAASLLQAPGMARCMRNWKQPCCAHKPATWQCGAARGALWDS